MRWFWQKKPQDTVDYLFEILPETIEYQGKTWGLRIKKEKGQCRVRYVTRHANSVARREGKYAVLEAKRADTMEKSLRNMVRKLLSMGIRIWQ